MHTALVDTNSNPDWQDLHVTDATVFCSWYVPAEQLVHTALLDTNSNPDWQYLHVDPILLYRPTSQAVQSDSNVLPGKLDFPATQFSHALPADVLYFPTAQS